MCLLCSSFWGWAQAGVPGMVGGMLRHMRSLRTMKRDHGWIHTLLEEAENERMHLLTFLQLREPGPLMRLMVLFGQVSPIAPISSSLLLYAQSRTGRIVGSRGSHMLMVPRSPAVKIRWEGLTPLQTKYLDVRRPLPGLGPVQGNIAIDCKAFF